MVEEKKESLLFPQILLIIVGVIALVFGGIAIKSDSKSMGIPLLASGLIGIVMPILVMTGVISL